MKPPLIFATAFAISLAAAVSTGTWKLNVQKSATAGCPASALQMQTIAVPAEIMKASTTARASRTRSSNPLPTVMHFDLLDAQTLAATPPSAPACRLIFQKQ